MKYLKNLIILVCISSFALMSCEEEGDHEPFVFDNQKPGVVTNVKLVAVPGGFDIKFDAPSDTDLLYVKVSYDTEAIGQTELRASKFSNTFEVRGYGNEEEKVISFIAVDKSGNESDMVTASGIPLKAPIKEIQNSATINADFGGARFNWDNTEQEDLVIDLLTEDDFGKFEINQTLYSSVADGSANLRGFDPIPTKFAFILRDQYKNKTDTIFPTTEDKLLTPLFESTLDKSLFSQYQLIEGDEIWTTFGGVVAELFNDITNSNNDFARATIVNERTFFTLDLGVSANLSRFKLHMRRTRYFSVGAPKVYTIYGTNEVPSPDGDMSNWIKLRECVATSPSGNTYGGSNNQGLSNEDEEAAINGSEFSLSPSPPVRYIRIEFLENFEVSGYIIFSELSFWGEIL